MMMKIKNWVARNRICFIIAERDDKLISCGVRIIILGMLRLIIKHYANC